LEQAGGLELGAKGCKEVVELGLVLDVDDGAFGGEAVFAAL
jgi:hypothetical protein